MKRKSLVWRDELKRKAFHLIWIFLALGAWWIEPLWGIDKIRQWLVILLFVSLVFDFFRVECGWRFASALIRSKERAMFCGASTAMFGVLLVFSLASFEVAVLATLFMGVGDLVAGLVRKVWGRHTFLKKTWEGFVAGALCSVLLGFVLVSNWVLVVSMAVAAQLIENAVISLDDNVLMIVVAGFVGELVLFFV